MRKHKMPLAFSYLRFSSPQQADGDSIRRQVAKTADWCKRHQAQLDKSLELSDQGVSAFKGKHRENPDLHALAAFLNNVKSGRIPRGSYLVVESLDRLSREKIRPALTLLLNLIEAGVKVVQLIPAEAIYDEDVEPMALMQAIMELNRGHSESKVKSERVGAAWARLRKEAGVKVITRKVPGWIRYDSGKLEIIPERAATVRRIFAMARDGDGVHAIALALNKDKVPVMGRTEFKNRSVQWNETVVYHVLKSRATYGEFQPSKGYGSDRQAVGDPITNYFPPVITRDTFHAASLALKSRSKNGSGRRGKHVNLFAGLLRDARDGGSLTYKHLSKRPSVIIPVGAKQGKGSVWSSFPAVPLEDAILSELREVKVSDLRGENRAARKVESLAGRLAEIDPLIKAWEAKMDNPAIVDTVAAKLASLNMERKRVSEELADAQRDAASPLSESWGEFRTLADLLTKDKSDEMRVKVRAAMRRSIESITCLFLPGRGKSVRVAAVQIWFRLVNKSRLYFVFNDSTRQTRQAKENRPSWLVWSDLPTAKLPVEAVELAEKTRAVIREGIIETHGKQAPELRDLDAADLTSGIDLRRPDDVKIVQGILESADLSLFTT